MMFNMALNLFYHRLTLRKPFKPAFDFGYICFFIHFVRSTSVFGPSWLKIRSIPSCVRQHFFALVCNPVIFAVRSFLLLLPVGRNIPLAFKLVKRRIQGPFFHLQFISAAASHFFYKLIAVHRPLVQKRQYQYNRASLNQLTI
nr:ipa-53r [Bacillus subtilis subsp. subtilis str. 168]